MLVIDIRGGIAFSGKGDSGQGSRAELTRLIVAELAMPTSAVRLEMGDSVSVPRGLAERVGPMRAANGAGDVAGIGRCARKVQVLLCP